MSKLNQFLEYVKCIHAEEYEDGQKRGYTGEELEDFAFRYMILGVRQLFEIEFRDRDYEYRLKQKRLLEEGYDDE